MFFYSENMFFYSENMLSFAYYLIFNCVKNLGTPVDCLIVSCFPASFNGRPRDGGKKRNIYEKYNYGKQRESERERVRERERERERVYKRETG